MNETSLPLAGTQVNALDVRGLADIKRQVRSNDPKALKAAAQQFEAVFMQMVLKSMRDATPKEGLFDSDQSRMYESLLDQQLAQVMSSKKGLGLAQVIERQLTRQISPQTEDGTEEIPLDPVLRSFELMRQKYLNLPTPSAVPPSMPGSEPLTGTAAPISAREFISRMLPEANTVAEQTGIPASFLIGQAALESGWGRSEPRGSDGQPSRNLFGIKAGRNWTGDTVDATTVEFVQGVPQRRVERFRAYGSYAESFRDYAQLLTSNPRYANVLGSQDPSRFARGLQAAGYATDPAYANKLERVIGAVANASS